jgi:hypothetical protein
VRERERERERGREAQATHGDLHSPPVGKRYRRH